MLISRKEINFICYVIRTINVHRSEDAIFRRTNKCCSSIYISTLLKILSAERFVYSSGHPPLCMLSELLGMLNIIFGEKDRRSVSHCKRFVFKNQNAWYSRSFSFSLFYLKFTANWSPYHSHWFPLINRSFDHNSKTFFLNHNWISLYLRIRRAGVGALLGGGAVAGGT